MVRKKRTEAEFLAEIARQPPLTDALLHEAVLRVVRSKPELGRLLISELAALAVSTDRRFMKLEKEDGWVDTVSISALVVVEGLEQAIRIGQQEHREDSEGTIPPELIRDKMEDVAALAFEIVEQIQERTRQLGALPLANQQALEKLALLLR